MDEELDLGILPDLLGYQLRRAQVTVFQHFAGALGDWNVTPGQLGLLVLVSRNPGISQTALARAVGVERATLGEAIDRLHKRDLLRREPAPKDRRSYALHLSESGEKFLDDFLPRLLRHEEEVAGNLSAKERKTLIALLRHLAEARPVGKPPPRN
jgi:DNA-binding MarR family transcriptional regulator